MKIITIAEAAALLNISPEKTKIKLKQADIKPIGYKGLIEFYDVSAVMKIHKQTEPTLIDIVKQEDTVETIPDNSLHKPFLTEVFLYGSNTVILENNEASDELIYSKEVESFVYAFLYTGGKLNKNICQYQSSSKEYTFFLENCFKYYHIAGSVKSIGCLKNVFCFKTKPYILLEQLGKKIHSNGLKTSSEFEKTQVTFFLLYLNYGHFFRKKGVWDLILEHKSRIIKNLKSLNIKATLIGKVDVVIDKNDQEKFFTYICEVPFLIPECFHHKFPIEFIQHNKDYVLTYKSE